MDPNGPGGLGPWRVHQVHVLLPYFEVGPDVTTVFTIHNASPDPALAQVTLWTDWAAAQSSLLDRAR